MGETAHVSCLAEEFSGKEGGRARGLVGVVDGVWGERMGEGWRGGGCKDVAGRSRSRARTTSGLLHQIVNM